MFVPEGTGRIQRRWSADSQHLGYPVGSVSSGGAAESTKMETTSCGGEPSNSGPSDMTRYRDGLVFEASGGSETGDELFSLEDG